MSNTDSLPKFGIIKVSNQYCIDGEYCSGYKEYNVDILEYWKSGIRKNQAKEVKTFNNKYFRETTKSGWREYYKKSKEFRNVCGIGQCISFEPNMTTNGEYNYNRVNLGGW